MSKLEDRLAEDRKLRDAARAVLVADIDHARSSFSAKGVADRVGTRIGDGAVEVFDLAKKKAGSNGGIIAALIGAMILWLGREPLLEAFERATEAAETEDKAETADESVTDPQPLDANDAEEEAPPTPASSAETPGDQDEQ